MQRDAERGRKLGDDLNRIAGTSLDKGVEIEALARMPRERREPIIARSAAGERVSARSAAPTSEPPPTRSPSDQADLAIASILRAHATVLDLVKPHLPDATGKGILLALSV